MEFPNASNGTIVISDYGGFFFFFYRVIRIRIGSLSRIFWVSFRARSLSLDFNVISVFFLPFCTYYNIEMSERIAFVWVFSKMLEDSRFTRF